jgi:hypothetical protein
MICFQKPRYVYEIPKWGCYRHLLQLVLELLNMSKVKCSAWLRNLPKMTVCCDYLLKIIIRSHVKRTLLLRLLLQRSPPDAVFASSGGRAISLPVARGNKSVRLVPEFVAILTNSIVVFLSVVVRCLPPAAAAAGW